MELYNNRRYQPIPQCCLHGSIRGYIGLYCCDSLLNVDMKYVGQAADIDGRIGVSSDIQCSCAVGRAVEDTEHLLCEPQS